MKTPIDLPVGGEAAKQIAKPIASQITTSGRDKVFPASLGGKLLRVRELSGRARQAAERDFVVAAKPWLTRLLASSLMRRNLSENRGEDLDSDEIKAAGLRGLGDAMGSWDPERCPSFAHFARWRVVFAVAQAAREACNVPGVRASRFDVIGEFGDDDGSVEVAAEGDPESALIEAEERRNQATREEKVRRALAALTEAQRSALRGLATGAKTRALDALRAELLRLGVEASS